MEKIGRVTSVVQTHGVLRVSADCSEYRNGDLIERFEAVVDVPMKFAEAYYVGREVKILFSPIEK